MGWVGRFAWDHNAFYHRVVVRRVPRGSRRVLDVGCGAGAFAGVLAGRVAQVDAIDRSGVMIAAARRAVPGNVRCVLGDVLTEPLPEGGYDAIVSVTALHHLPLEEILPKLGRALRPGGVLVAIALPRSDLPRELPIEVVAAIGQRVLAGAFWILRRFGSGTWFERENSHGEMPVVLDPPLTTRQVRAQARVLLPGSRVRRLLYWRYLLVWHKPIR